MMNENSEDFEEEEKENDEGEEENDDDEEENENENENENKNDDDEEDEENVNIFDVEINEQNVINLISEDIINTNKIKNHMQVLFANYKFENFNIIVKFRSVDKTSIFIGVEIEDFYKKSFDENDYFHPEYSFKETFASIKDAITFLYCKFRKDYSYSKITDRIEKNKDLIRQEQKEISYLMFTKNSSFEEIKSNFNCCVCFEPNFVMTKCNHNLCRKCFIKIEKKKCNQCDDETYCTFSLRRSCPMCRAFL